MPPLQVGNLWSVVLPDDPNLVQFTGPTDEADPMNRLTVYKIIAVAVVSGMSAGKKRCTASFHLLPTSLLNNKTMLSCAPLLRP